jgi:hypothetical protein
MRHSQGKTLLAVLLVAVLGVAVLGRITDRGSSDGQLAWAQVAASSCGNAILEPGEQCDPPGSITCPPGSPASAFLPCNANCTCPPTVLDHFQCYEVKPAFFAGLTVTVQDQFGTLTETIRYPHRLCAAANKNGEGIQDPTHHLVGYRTKPSPFTKRLRQTLVDQFGTQLLDVVRPDVLDVPSSKDGVPQASPLDHFQCYTVKRSKGAPKFAKRTVSVSDQFETVTLTLVKPVLLCAPASKNNEDPTAPSHPDHLTCYKTADGKFPQSTHTISNQFGLDEVTLIHRRELCVPSLKNPVTTTTSSTTTTTAHASTTTTSSTSTTTSTTSSSTSSTTSTTTSSTTTTTHYGSPSRAFLIPTDSLLD